MELINAYVELQKLFIDHYGDLPIDEIVTCINENNLFSNKIISLSTMRLIASIVYIYPALLDQVVHILSLIENINIDLDLFTNQITNKEIINRSMVIYILLCLSNHIKLGDIQVPLTAKQLTFINPIYMSKFPNHRQLTQILDFNMIIKLPNEEKIKIRNKMHSCHPIVQSMIDDDVDLLNEIISTSNFDVDDIIPKSIFEIHPILSKALPIQYAAFLGSVNCFKYLLHKTDSIDYEELMEFAIAGGNSEIIHIIENNCEDYTTKLLNLAILYMRNDLIEYLLNNYELKINCDSYINCIYASNYEALILLQELEKDEEINDNKTLIESIEEFISYNTFMISISDIIGFEYIESLKIDILKSSFHGKKFDIMNYIINHKLINDDFKDILKPITIVLSFREEQVIKDFQTFEGNYTFWSQYCNYLDDDDWYYNYDWYDDDYYWDYFWGDLSIGTDDYDINNYERTHKKKFRRNQCNRSRAIKKFNKNKTKYSQRLKKKCVKKNMMLDIKEYFDTISINEKI